MESTIPNGETIGKMDELLININNLQADPENSEETKKNITSISEEELKNLGQIDESLQKSNIANLQANQKNSEEIKENSEKTKENTIVITQDELKKLIDDSSEEATIEITEDELKKLIDDSSEEATIEITANDLRNLIDDSQKAKLENFLEIAIYTKQTVQITDVLEFMIQLQPLLNIDISKVLIEKDKGIKTLHGTNQELVQIFNHIQNKTTEIIKDFDPIFFYMIKTKENRLKIKESFKKEELQPQEIKKTEILTIHKPQTKDLDIFQKKNIYKCTGKNENLKKIKQLDLSKKNYIINFFKDKKAELHTAFLFIHLAKRLFVDIHNTIKQYKRDDNTLNNKIINSFIYDAFLKINIFFAMFEYLLNFKCVYFFLNTDDTKVNKEEINNFTTSIKDVYCDLIDKKKETNKQKGIKYLFNFIKTIQIKHDISQPISWEDKVYLNNFANLNLKKYLEKINNN
jgi:hypothetical protein